MTGAHATGGGLGALLGAAISEVLNHFVGWTISPVDAALIGSAALAAGAGLGHVWVTTGILPAVKAGLFGRKAPQAVRTAPVPSQTVSTVVSAQTVTPPTVT